MTEANNITTNQLIDVNQNLVSLILKYGSTYDDIMGLFEEKNRISISCAVSDPQKISYYTQKKLDLMKEKGAEYGFYVPRIRLKYGIMTKPGKFFKHILPELEPAQVQQMVAEYKVIVHDLLPAQNQTELVLSTDIKKWYHEDNYHNPGGSLGASCMSGADCQESIEFYENYNVSILILKTAQDKIKGRALVWHDVKFDHLSDSFDFLDRIYVNNNNDFQLFYDYAKKHDIVQKAEQNYCNKEDFIFRGELFTDDINIDSINAISYDQQFPYVDTFSFKTGDMLSNCSGDQLLDQMHGGYTEVEICAECGEIIEDGDGQYIENEGSFCHNCVAGLFDYCQMCDEYVEKDTTTYIEGSQICDGCIDNHYIRCNECEEYIKNEDAYLTDDNEVYCDSCYYDNFFVCDYCGEDHSLENHYSNDEKDNVCRTCFDEAMKQCKICNEFHPKEDIEGGVCPDCLIDIMDADDEPKTEMVA